MVSIFVLVLVQHFVQHFVCKISIFFDECGQESLANGNDTEYAVQSSSLDRNFCDADFLPRSIWLATRQSLLKNLMQDSQGDGTW
jgi:hypothetical protein